MQFTLGTGTEITGYYAQFKYDGEDEKQDLSKDEKWALIMKPFVEYGNANGKSFTEEEENTLYNLEDDDSSSEE